MPQDSNKQITLDEWERRTFERYGVPENLRRSIVGQESGGDVSAKSPTGVRGRYQMTEDTAKQYGYDRNDPWQQPVAAARHLRTLYDGVKKRNPGFNDKQAWLGASAEYYFGGNAFDADGTLSQQSRDGYSNPAKYATSIAERWSAFDRGGETPESDATPQPPTQSRPAPDSTARRLGLVPAEGMFFDLSGGQSKPAPKLTPKLSTRGPVVYPSQGQEPGLFTPPRSVEEATADVRHDAAVRQAQIGPEVARREEARRQFEAQPWHQRYAQNAETALAGVGGSLARGARNLTRIPSPYGSPQRPPTIGGAIELMAPGAMKKWDEFAAKREQELAAREDAASNLESKIVRGGVSGAANLALLGGAAMTGGIPAVMGATGIQQDWERDPVGSAVTTATAGLPIKVGQYVSPLAQRAVSGLASPVARKAAQIGIEAGAGGLANVGQYAGTQALLGREIDSEEAIAQGIVGAGLSGVTAPRLRPQARPQTLGRPEPLPAPSRTLTPDRAQAPLAQAQAQEPPPRSVRPEIEGITPDFRAAAQRQALEMMGMPPEQIDAEINRRAQAVAETEPAPQAPRPVEPVRQPSPQPIAQPAQLSAVEQRRQERVRLYEVSRNIAGRSLEQARTAMDAGDFGEAIAQTEAYRKALRDAARFAPSESPGARSQAAKEIARAGAMLDDVKRQAKEQRRVENQPTRGLTAQGPRPVAQAPESGASSPLLGSVVNPEGGIPRAPESLSGPFGRLARGQERGMGEPQDNLRIISRIQQLGGINTKGVYSGELQNLGEARRVGAVRRQGGSAPDEMIELLAEEGYPVDRNDLNTLWRAIDDDRAGNPVYPTTRSRTAELDQEMADYYANQAAQPLPTGQGIPRVGLPSERLTTPTPAQRRIPPAPLSPRRPGSRTGIPPPQGRGRQSETGALEEIGDFFGEMAREEAPATTDRNLATAYRKLETNDPEVISQLLRDADKRFKKSATPEEKAAADRAWAKVQNLSADEQNAVSQVIPERTFAPVREGYQGEPGERYNRSIEDIPTAEPNAQLDKNLNDLLSFFDEVVDKPKPKIVTDAAQRLRDAASGKLAGFLKDEGGSANLDLGARQFADIAIVAGWKVYERGMTYAKWTREVIKTAGERVRPHLRAAWEQIQTDYRQMEKEARGGARINVPADVRAKAIADSPADDTKVSVVSLGLESKFPPQPARRAKPRDIEVNIADIALGRDDLSKGRMNQVESALKEGFTRAGGKIGAVSVVPDPQRPGKWVVLDDGNHRVALLQLAGVKGKVPVKAWMAPSAIKQFLADEGGSAKLDLGASKRGQVSETLGGLQTAAQLGNPRFVIRNVLQHVAYGKQERGATRLAAALDWAFTSATGKPRQITRPRGSDLSAYVRNWGKAIDAYKKGDPLPGKPNADYITADANALDKAVGKVMTYINEIPDAANWQTRFEGSLKSIVEAAKKSKTKYDVDDIVDQAWMEANRAALRDSNFVSKTLNTLKKALNTASSPLTGTDKFGLGDFIIKYAQTPGALLKRGLEHSPLGLFQVAKEAATPGPFRRRNTLLAFSRVMTGTAESIGLGAALAAAGVLVGPEEESRSGAAMEREEGVRGYSLNASALRRLLTGESTKLQKDDTLYSIDWLQPWAMGASAGAAVYNLHKDGKLGPSSAAGSTGKAVYDSLAKTLDVMGDQSVLKNLTRYMGKATGETFTDKAANFMKAVGLDVPSSFTPSWLRQVRQVADPFERDTRPEQPGGVRGFVSEAKNRAIAQLPGVSQTFPTRPSLLTGQDKKTELGKFGVPARIAAQFSPANVSTYAPQPVAREISRLNDAGEKVSVSFPRALGEKETGKRGYREPTAALRVRERQFAEAFAEQSRELISHPDYLDADDTVRASAINGLAKYLRTRTRKELEEREIQSIIDAAARGVERRMENNQ